MSAAVVPGRRRMLFARACRKKKGGVYRWFAVVETSARQIVAERECADTRSAGVEATRMAAEFNATKKSVFGVG